MSFIDLLIREKVIDFFIISILSLLFYLSRLFRQSRLFYYNEICDKSYIKAYVETYKVYDNICDKYYYYNEVRFNNINKFDIKDSLLPLLSHFSYLLRFPRFSRLSRYNEICNEIYVKAYKIYDNICDKCYYCDKARFNDINKSNIKM